MDNALSHYLPDILKPFEEFRQITNTETQETDALWASSEQALDNAFFMRADENGVKLYEEMLGIKPAPGQTLDERKFAVLVKYQESRPYTYRFLRQQLDTLCKGDYWVDLQPANYYIKILLALTSKHNMGAVQEMVGRMLPANMVREIGLRYNQHGTLHHLTHAQLAGKTQREIRNEVL